MAEVPRVRTALSDTEAAPLLLTALKAAGEQPHRDEARLLLAQLRFEGLGSCNNHNPGNISAVDTGSADFFRPVWFEPAADASPQILKTHEAMLEHKAPRAFRSYPDFSAGFADYVHFVQSRFPSIIAAARTGDAAATANAIKTSGYTPDAPSSLPQTLASIVAELEKRGIFAELPLAHAGPAPQQPPAPAPPSSSSSSSPSSPTAPAGALSFVDAAAVAMFPRVRGSSPAFAVGAADTELAAAREAYRLARVLESVRGER